MSGSANDRHLNTHSLTPLLIRKAEIRTQTLGGQVGSKGNPWLICENVADFAMRIYSPLVRDKNTPDPGAIYVRNLFLFVVGGMYVCTTLANA